MSAVVQRNKLVGDWGRHARGDRSDQGRRRSSARSADDEEANRALHFAESVTQLREFESKQSLGISRMGEETNKSKLDGRGDTTVVRVVQRDVTLEEAVVNDQRDTWRWRRRDGMVREERDRVYEQQRRPEVEGNKQGNRRDKM